MSAKKETFYVSQSVRGWMVRTSTGRQSGPYTDREDAITSALVAAKGNRPTSVRVKHLVDGWRVECTYDKRPNAH